METTINLSDEQRAAVDAIRSGNNVIIVAVAGAGKTTTIFNSIHPSDGKCLLLTYNAQLKESSRESCGKFGVSGEQLSVHSYNSFGYAYVGKACATDEGFLKRYNVKTNMPKWSRIYIDEAQDMTNIHYTLVMKILRLCPSAQIVLVGDPRQTIYGFKGADHRYLTFGDKIFKSMMNATESRPWVSVELHTSYRLTKENAALMNSIIGVDIFHSDRPGSVPEYLFCSPFKLPLRILNLCKKSPSNTFILAYSTGGARSPAKAIENALVADKIPVIVIDDDTKGTSDVIEHKCIISTFHRTKGLGRDNVIILNFDEMFYDMAKTEDPAFIPNILYVAMTRGIKNLIMVNSPSKKPFAWMERIIDSAMTHGSVIETKTMRTVNDGRISVTGTPSVLKNRKSTSLKKSVTELVKFLSFGTLARLKEIIRVETIRPAQYSLDIAPVAEGSVGGLKLTESVADITGIAIPAYLEYASSGSMSIYNVLKEVRPLKSIGEYADPENLLKLATEYWSYRSKYLFKKAQISSYKWLGQEHLDTIAQYSHEMFDGRCEVEVSTVIEGTNLEIFGSIDCLSNEFLYEYKCTSELSIEHFVQTLLYRYILGKERRCRCVNLLTGEIVELGDENIDEIVRLVYADKLLRPGPASDADFLEATKNLELDASDLYEDI